MARAINGTATNKLKNTATVPVTAVPCTFACWFNPVNVTTNYTLMACLKQSSGDGYFVLGIGGGMGGDPVYCEATDGSTYASATTSTSYVADTWQHACAVFTANSGAGARAVYLNAAGEGTNTTNVTPTGITAIQIAGYSDDDGDFDSLNGSIAECGIWNVALNANERGMLAKGFAPPFVRPDALVFYAPLWGRHSPETDRWGNHHLTISGTVTQSAHPPQIFYPVSPHIMAPGGAGGAPAPIICHLSTTGGWVF